MKRFFWMPVLSIAAVLVPFLAFAQDAPAEGQPRVVLIADEKNPQLVYGVTLCPIIGPILGASYAGESPVSASIPPQFTRAAAIFAVVDAVEIGAGAGLGYWGASAIKHRAGLSPDARRGTGARDRFIGMSAGSLVGGFAAMATNIAPGNQFADACVAYNKKLHEKFKWRVPEVSYDGERYAMVLGADFY